MKTSVGVKDTASKLVFTSPSRAFYFFSFPVSGVLGYCLPWIKGTWLSCKWFRNARRTDQPIPPLLKTPTIPPRSLVLRHSPTLLSLWQKKRRHPLRGNIMLYLSRSVISPFPAHSPFSCETTLEQNILFAVSKILSLVTSVFYEGDKSKTENFGWIMEG